MGQKYYYGYRIVAASSVIQMMYLGCVFSFGVFFPEFESEFGWSRATIAGASSLMTVMMGIVGILIGRLGDVIGPRLLLTISVILFSTSYIMMSKMTSVWGLYLFYGIIGGLGMGAHDVLTLSTVARWFIRYRGLMSDLVKAGAGIGQVLIPLSASLLVSIYDWRQASLAIGLVTLVIMVSASQVMRRDPSVFGLWRLAHKREAIRD